MARHVLMRADPPFNPPRIWLGEQAGGPLVRLFRRAFHLPSPPERATLRLFAEARYHLWVNGHYVGRGPILHHPHRLPLDRHDLTSWLRAGGNVIAVLVWTPHTWLHQHVPTGQPGLAAELSLDDHVMVTDKSWRVTDRTGWRGDVPRRGWAVGYVEVFDAGEAPVGWREPDFDDADWSKPDVYPTALPDGDSAYFDSPLPPLKYRWNSADKLIGLWQVDDPPPPIDRNDPTLALGKRLLDQPWRPPTHVKLSDPMRIEGLTPEHGAVLCLDLGAQHSGQVCLECDCPSPGVIDVGWSEYCDAGRPRVVQKGASYVDRLLATTGRLSWEPMQFGSGRYLALFFRGFTGAVTVHRVGMRVSEPALEWTGSFTCEDERLNRVWSLCQRTLIVGTQEGLMDCPSREQATYVGDGHPVAQWIAQLTGDFSYWKYLVTEQFRRQDSSGLFRTAVFTGQDNVLIDYLLLAVIGTRDYLRLTGDLDTVRPLLPACRRTLAWFDQHRDGRGLFAWPWSRPTAGLTTEERYDPHWNLAGARLNLFIDHPGMGWHNVDEPGIDRRGLNTAINALLVLARRALADLEDRAGSADHAQALRRVAAETFFDPARGVFTDGILEDRPLEQISQQTNAWAALARLCHGVKARSILKKMLDPDDVKLARCGPYFWWYLYPALAGAGLHREALAETARLWTPMIERGATTAWETFTGDDLDTACHPWSAAPAWFLPVHIAGLPDAALPGQTVELRPRYDLLRRVEARLFTTAGLVSIAWKNRDLRGQLPAGVKARLRDPAGRILAQVSGRWRHRLP